MLASIYKTRKRLLVSKKEIGHDVFKEDLKPAAMSTLREMAVSSDEQHGLDDVIVRGRGKWV